MAAALANQSMSEDLITVRSSAIVTIICKTFGNYIKRIIISRFTVCCNRTCNCSGCCWWYFRWFWHV